MSTAFLEGLSVLSTVCALVFGYAAFSRGRKKDDAEDGGSKAAMMSDIGYIKANTEEIKAEQKEQRSFNTEVVTRITAVEESTKQAHKRLDRLEGGEKG